MTSRTDQHDPRASIAMGRRYRRQTQLDLANELTRETGESWSRVMVGKLETGTKELTVPTLMAIAKIQDLPWRFYLEGPNEAKGDYLSSLDLALAGV